MYVLDLFECEMYANIHRPVQRGLWVVGIRQFLLRLVCPFLDGKVIMYRVLCYVIGLYVALRAKDLNQRF